jgi:hypothetical protein
MTMKGEEEKRREEVGDGDGRSDVDVETKRGRAGRWQ